ncbi:hypothetical protein [Hartmannibacter diazotrophicus]|uniref:hypothetical protein n=1 Tax=Hartmannibacter diazotrophicus TaxID=1482074 RepID=UPI0012FE330E|nr:hypothetical protein [Hartmannibacter diazotrophicus]
MALVSSLNDGLGLSLTAERKARLDEAILRARWQIATDRARAADQAAHEAFSRRMELLDRPFPRELTSKILAEEEAIKAADARARARAKRLNAKADRLWDELHPGWRNEVAS